MQVPKETGFMEGLSDAGCKWVGDELIRDFGTLMTHEHLNYLKLGRCGLVRFAGWRLQLCLIR